jgi:thiaminase/transcriptional activator TenA
VSSFFAEQKAGHAEIERRIRAHPFVCGLGDGTLPRDRFQFYLRQDYLFLIDYARVLAVCAARADDLETTARFARLLDATLNVEMEGHRRFCARAGVTPEELEATPAHPTTTAYADHLLATVWWEGLGPAVAALLPCQYGYREIAVDLGRSPEPLYQEWIDAYTSEDYRQLAEWLVALADRLADGGGPRLRAAMARAYARSQRHELAFWEMAWIGG